MRNGSRPTDLGQLSIDPEQFFIDPSQLSIDPDQFPIDPSQLSIEPGQLSIDLDQLLIDPSRRPIDVSQVSIDPGQFSMGPCQLAMEPGQLSNQTISGAPQPVNNLCIPLYTHQEIAHSSVGNELLLDGWWPGDYSLSGIHPCPHVPTPHPVSESDHPTGTAPGYSVVNGDYVGWGYCKLDLPPGASGAQEAFNNFDVQAGTGFQAPEMQSTATFNQNTATLLTAPISLGSAGGDFIQANTIDIGFVTATFDGGFHGSLPVGSNPNTVLPRQYVPDIHEPVLGVHEEHDSVLGPAVTNTAKPLIPIVEFTHAPRQDSRRLRGESSPTSQRREMRSASKLTGDGI